VILEILQENLSVALSQALKFISSKAQLPILSNFLIKAGKGVLTIKATDLENGITVFLGAKTEEEGEVSVSAKIFSDFVLALSPGKVDIETEEEMLIVKSGKNKAKFSTMPSSEFPKEEEGGERKRITSLDPALLKKVSERVSFAVSSDVSRPTMTGVYFDNKKSALKIVGTDGFRLSLLEEKGEVEDFEINIPVKIVEEAAHLGEKQKDKIEIFLNEKKTVVVFKMENAEIFSRLIDGKYPPYIRIIPSEKNIIAKIDRQDFLRAVKTASVFSKDAGSIVKISFGENVLKISSQTASLGENENEIECQKEGEDLEINFNFRYLLDVLSKMSGKEISFETEGEGKPCVFREKEPPNFLHLIMPVKKS
jgi:DNA polymerase III subunit beta